MKIMCVSSCAVGTGNKSGGNALFNERLRIISKPDSSLIRQGRPFFVPDFAGRFDAGLVVAARICRLGRDIALRFAGRYYEVLALGWDFTARDLSDELTAQGLPDDVCHGFDCSLALGEWTAKNVAPDLLAVLDEAVSCLSRFYTLKMGDLVCLSLGVKREAVQVGDVLEESWGDGLRVSLKVK